VQILAAYYYALSRVVPVMASHYLEKAIRIAACVPWPMQRDVLQDGEPPGAVIGGAPWLVQQ
jgi:hypothetical protein